MSDTHALTPDELLRIVLLRGWPPAWSLAEHHADKWRAWLKHKEGTNERAAADE